MGAGILCAGTGDVPAASLGTETLSAAELGSVSPRAALAVAYWRGLRSRQAQPQGPVQHQPGVWAS